MAAAQPADGCDEVAGELLGRFRPIVPPELRDREPEVLAAGRLPVEALSSLGQFRYRDGDGVLDGDRVIVVVCRTSRAPARYSTGR